MTRKARRLALIGGALGVVAIAVGLVLWGLSGSIAFFLSPTDLVERGAPEGRMIRVGGLVQEGSIERGADQVVQFTVTDGRNVVRVRYQGVLPDLFRERQGVVAEGRLDGGLFRAQTILARHDENYMPREVADALKRAGHFIGDEGRAATPRPPGGGS
jgi:cytochrome c-type biogenesis protein CcmE